MEQLNLYQNFFSRELDAGTPFSFEVAKDMKHTGIVTLIVGFIGSVVAAGVHETMDILFDGIEKMDNDYLYSCGLSICFIVMSLLCKYGAEIKECEK